jgi:hypothetical protein
VVIIISLEKIVVSSVYHVRYLSLRDEVSILRLLMVASVWDFSEVKLNSKRKPAKNSQGLGRDRDPIHRQLTLLRQAYSLFICPHSIQICWDLGTR